MDENNFTTEDILRLKKEDIYQFTGSQPHLTIIKGPEELKQAVDLLYEICRMGGGNKRKRTVKRRRSRYKSKKRR